MKLLYEIGQKPKQFELAHGEEAYNIKDNKRYTADKLGNVVRVKDTTPILGKNKLINGNFDLWEYATSQTTNGYNSSNRWTHIHNISTKIVYGKAFTLGQTDVPNNPEFYARTVVTSVASASAYTIQGQRIENVRTFSGETATLSFWAKADTAKNIAIELYQNFGTGGTPSAPPLNIPAQKLALTTTWAKYTVTFNIPSISGKTLGTDGNDYLGLYIWFEGGSDFDDRTDTLGQQSGTFDIAQVQLEKGSEATEFEDEDITTTENKCARYYQEFIPGYSTLIADGYYTAGTYAIVTLQRKVRMRAFPTATSLFGTTSNVDTLVATGGTEEIYIRGRAIATGRAYMNITHIYFNSEL